MSKEWKLVPVEPTDEMKEAGAPSCEYTGTVCAALCYEAMIAAAPVPPAHADTGEVEQLREAYVAAGEREHALREELARNNVVAFSIEVEKLLCAVIGRDWSASGLSVESLTKDIQQRLTVAEQRNATLIASIVALPDEFKELSGCENTAGVYACIDYISDWVAELAKPTESGASDEQ